jgi:hypothetical protein
MQAPSNDRPPDWRSICLRSAQLNQEIPKSTEFEIHILRMTGEGARGIL